MSQHRKTPTRSAHFIRAWRLHRKITIADLAERLSLSKSTISRIETGALPYTQDTLEAIAAALDCSPIDLLARAPAESAGLWTLWGEATPRQRQHIVAVVTALLSAPPP